MTAGPAPRLSAWMAVENAVPNEVKPGPLWLTLARAFGSELGRTIAHIALVLWVPTTLTAVSVAVIVAFPLACIRSPDLLAALELAVLSMNALFAVRLASTPGVPIAPVVFARLTESVMAEPAGMMTWTPG